MGVAQGLGHVSQRAERAGALAFGNRPIQPVLLAFVAQELLRELMIAAEVFLLRIGDFAEHADGGQFAIADPAGQDFVLTGRGVESPLAGVGPL